MPAKLNNLASTSASKMPTKLKLKLANACDDLSTKIDLTTQRKEYRYHIVHSKRIGKKHYDKMMSLFEPLMRESYESSSWGWNEEEKLAEWRHARTRVVFVVEKDAYERGSESIIYNRLPEEEEDLIGFMCFRFESGADKKESALYVYELHVHPEHQRRGLGLELMRMSKVIALAFKMDKIMLTVFRSNSAAQQFYNKLKFSIDQSSPAKNEADYDILSSRLAVR